ncbi:MAG: hypothetical protein ACTS8U_01775 [Arsenophonus sp. ET-DL9-MAG3]
MDWFFVNEIILLEIRIHQKTTGLFVIITGVAVTALYLRIIPHLPN